MSEARQLMERGTAAVLAGDTEALAACYRPDAVLVTPDGTFKGREQVVDYFKTFIDAFSDRTWTAEATLDSGNRALDEGFFSATHTGPLQAPDGTTIPATNKRITMREADVCTVVGGAISEHHMYFDNLEFLGQLGVDVG